MNARRRQWLSILGIVALATSLAACAPTVALQPAALADAPSCAAVTVRLPDEISGLAKRETNAQATGAWGQPTAVVLHCGVEAPPPTSLLPCYTVDGIDWLVDDTDSPTFVFTSYGRDPAVTVAIDNTVVAGVSVLESLSYAVSQLPATGACISVDDLAAVS